MRTLSRLLRFVEFILEFLATFLIWYYADAVRRPIGIINDAIASGILQHVSWSAGVVIQPFLNFGLLVLEALIATSIFSFVLRRILRAIFRRGRPAPAAPAAAAPAAPPLAPRGGHTLSRFEHLRHAVLVLTLFASFLFAIWEGSILSGYVQATFRGTEGDFLNDMFIVAVVAMVYHAFCMAGLLCRRPAQVGWELAAFLAGIVPLIVLCVYTFSWSGGPPFTAFQWRAWVIMWLVEMVDVVELFLVALQLTRRSSVGFGIVDDAGQRM